MSFSELVVGLFPGQGAYQQGGLTAQWAAGDPVVREVFGALDEVSAERAGGLVSSVVFGAVPPTLGEMLEEHQDVLQLAIFGSSLVAHRARSVAPDVLLGHSLGEISALVAAGAFSVADGASVICDRNEALRSHAPADARMLVLACGRVRCEQLLALVGAADLVLAVDNGPEQTVISGPGAQVAIAEAVAKALGVGTALVGSAYGFHNPALREVGREFTRKISGYRQGRLAARVYSPILCRYYRDGDDLASLLGLHLTEPVEFRTALETFYSTGVRFFAELGAGGALTGLVRKAFPAAVGLRTQQDQEVRSPATHPHAAEAVAPHDHEAEPAVVPTQAAVRKPPVDRASALARLQELYAEALEYPVEVLTEDAVLEADLGVDSIRQTELMIRSRKLFELGEPDSSVRTADFDTLGKIVDYVLGALNASGLAGTAR
jgi:[acyl-carrier-protein] S-malonyltransferase